MDRYISPTSSEKRLFLGDDGHIASHLVKERLLEPEAMDNYNSQQLGHQEHNLCKLEAGKIQAQRRIVVMKSSAQLRS